MYIQVHVLVHTRTYINTYYTHVQCTYILHVYNYNNILSIVTCTCIWYTIYNY